MRVVLETFFLDDIRHNFIKIGIGSNIKATFNKLVHFFSQFIDLSDILFEDGVFDYRLVIGIQLKIANAGVVKVRLEGVIRVKNHTEELGLDGVELHMGR